jgi:hypothetical protein
MLRRLNSALSGRLRAILAGMLGAQFSTYSRPANRRWTEPQSAA